MSNIIIDGVGKDAEIVTNSAGGKQSKSPMAMHLVDPRFLAEFARNKANELEYCDKSDATCVDDEDMEIHGCYKAIEYIADYMQTGVEFSLQMAMDSLNSEEIQQVINIAKKVKPSHRGELEITSINNEYIKRKSLKAIMLGRGVAWLDTGTPSNLSHANTFIECIQNRQGYYVACLEEIAYRQGFINLSQLKKLGENLQNSEYGKYILDIVDEELKEEYK